MNDTPQGRAPNLKSRDAYQVWISVPIRYADLDTNGHVNNGGINTYFEEARVTFRRQALEMVPNAPEYKTTGMAIAKFTVEYLAPVFYPGTVDVGSRVTRIGRTSYVLSHGVFRDDNCVALAEVVLVAFDRETGRAEPLDPAFRNVLEVLLEKAQ